MLGDLKGALSYFNNQTKLFEELHEAYPINIEYKNNLAISYERLGDTYCSLNNLEKAFSFYNNETKLFEELYQNLEVIELRYEATRLQIRQIETYVKTKKSQLAVAMQSANDSQIDKMLESAKKLDVLLKSAKEKTRT